MAEQPQPPCWVNQLVQVMTEVRALRERAARKNVRGLFLATLEEMSKQLRESPYEWGDPQYHTVRAGGTVYHALCRPLTVRYVVYEPEHLVCILSVRPYPNDVLERDD